MTTIMTVMSNRMKATATVITDAILPTLTIMIMMTIMTTIMVPFQKMQLGKIELQDWAARSTPTPIHGHSPQTFHKCKYSIPPPPPSVRWGEPPSPQILSFH